MHHPCLQTDTGQCQEAVPGEGDFPSLEWATSFPSLLDKGCTWFHLPQRVVWLRHIETGAKKKVRTISSISPRVGVIVVLSSLTRPQQLLILNSCWMLWSLSRSHHCELHCKPQGTAPQKIPAAFAPEETNSQQSHHEHPAISPLNASQVFAFTYSSCLSPFPSPPPARISGDTLSSELRYALCCSSQSRPLAVHVHDATPGPHIQPPNTMCVPMTNPYSHMMHTNSSGFYSCWRTRSWAELLI